MKRVCLFIENLTKQGGEERMCVTLANMLADSGYYVLVVDMERPYFSSPSYKLSPKIRSRILNGCRVERKMSQIPWLKHISLWKYRLFLILHHINVVIDVDIHRSLITSKVVSGTGIKIISWDHFNYDRFALRPTRPTLHDCFLESVDKLVVLTKSDRFAYIEKEGIPDDKVVQIYNPSPIQCNTIVSHQSSHKVLAVGRLSWEKGFDRLLEAWKMIESKIDGWELEVVGDGAMREQLIDYIQQNKIKHVSLLPFTNNIQKKYEEAAFLVIPSHFEGFPLAMIEAFSMSLPVVSFIVTGPKEIIVDGKDGFLVENGNVNALAERMLFLMENGQKRMEMGEIAYHTSSRFRFETICKQWTTLIESL